ncbi:MAG: Ni/Fe-hydrogenase cytochrome b subunit [Candidatus Eisenbacteria bacterium]|uniref:Ni/Fe-hydrogenase cytochrome b subunit n=1 Tax=Eiseniibacteriota bacterium TaxID=2212470 RepID=A0A956NDS8_UNCEI|nr:Ni/Fe-hydrogenase cytochrome b subunit [Candidatus Eisenbacteria bacterium]
MTDRFLRKFTMFRLIGLICLVSGLYATFLRFTQGLGASTNLSDTFPWGLWVGFDVVCGVGLAAGGFTISAMVYILRIEKYRPLARPAVLTAFIGYLLVVGGLIFDLGLPWRIWHPMVMWNPHSVMFEVAWCVTLYTTVLAAEASAMVFEKLKMERSTKVAHKLTFPLTVAAVCLSMLHQSSLGSLFLLVPGRLHELWWTPFLPLLFFLSAIAVGLVMTIIESNLSARAFGREIEADVLQNAAKVASVVMVLYLVVRFADLIHRGVLTTLWPLDRAGGFFILEILAGFALPIVLFNSTKITKNSRWLYHAAQLALLGFIINRLNVSVTGFEVVSGTPYTPAWTEVAVTLMIVTIGVTAFYLAARYLPVFEKDTLEEQRRQTWKSEVGRRIRHGWVSKEVSKEMVRS